MVDDDEDCVWWCGKEGATAATGGEVLFPHQKHKLNFNFSQHKQASKQLVEHQQSSGKSFRLHQKVVGGFCFSRAAPALSFGNNGDK